MTTMLFEVHVNRFYGDLTLQFFMHDSFIFSVL